MSAPPTEYRPGWARARFAHVVLAVAAAVLCPLVSNGAQLPSTVPQPRVAYDMHGARINQIRATPDGQRLVSVSEDKTVRVWRMADLRLMRTIHVPSEAGVEGAVRSLAITPDGSEVIVGGWTGVAWHGRGQIYRFDLATGRLLQRLGGFPGVIESLAISRGGERLAVGLGGGGVRVLETSSGRELMADTEYAERVTFADFSANGVLATTSPDGCLRLYDADHRLVFRAQYPPNPQATGATCTGAEMGGVRFSPDGAQLAFGFMDRVEMVVMDVATRSIVRVLRVQDEQQRSLCCLNWSGDGTRLFMNGAHAGDGATPLYRVDLAGGTIDRLDVGRQKFTNILPLPDGGVVFSSEVPTLARVDAEGRRVAEAAPPNGDFRFGWESFRLSRDGTRLTLPMRADGSAVQYFGIGEEPDQAYREARADDIFNTAAPVRAGPMAVQATLEERGYTDPVLVNGRALQMKPFQAVRSWAAVPGGDAVVLGTQWSVMLVNAQGQVQWEQDLAGPAYQVNATADGRWVVAAIGDGTVRWYDARSGKETVGLFLHTNGRDWVAWRSDGYYASSPGGDEYIGWLVNRGEEQAPDFFRAVQFERRLYRPDLLMAALAVGDARAIQSADSLAGVLGSLSPPRVVIEDIQQQDGRLSVRFQVESAGAPIREVGIYADGIPMLAGTERVVAASGSRQTLSGTLALPTGVLPDVIRIEAETGSAIGSDETRPLQLPVARSGGRGTLRILAIGVGEFQDTRRCAGADCPITVDDLPNAPRDAEAIAAHFRQELGRQFADIRTHLLSDGMEVKPTKQAILARLRELEQAGPDDTTIVFLASHGIALSAASQEYYFLPRDARMAEVATLLGGEESPERLSSLLTATELGAALKRVAGIRLLIIDTCHAGIAAGKNNPYSLAKRSMASQIGVLSAASGDEQSYEAVGEPHGAFTLSVLEGLQGRADADRDGLVTVAEVFAYSGPRVAENMRRLNELAKKEDPEFESVTQTPTLAAIPAIEIAGLARPAAR